MKEIKKTSRNNKKILDEFNLNNEQIDKSIKQKIYIPIKFTDEKNQIKTIFKYKSKTKNYIFYECSLRNKCFGKGKIDIIKKKFYILTKCDPKIEHNYLSYDEFKNAFKNKQLDKNVITKKYIQKYYTELSIRENESIDNPTLKKNFLEITGINLNLSLSEISQIRNKLLDKYKNLSLEELVKKIDVPGEEIQIYSFDVKYEKKLKNKTIERNHKIIIFGLKKGIKLINKEYTDEFFFDSTFNIIPRNYRPYKFFVISGLPKDNKKPTLLVFCLLK